MSITNNIILIGPKSDSIFSGGKIKIIYTIIVTDIKNKMYPKDNNLLGDSFIRFLIPFLCSLSRYAFNMAVEQSKSINVINIINQNRLFLLLASL